MQHPVDGPDEVHRWRIGRDVLVIALAVVAGQVPGRLSRVHHVIDYLGTLVLSLAATSFGRVTG